MTSSTHTLIAALRILAKDIQSQDGVANAAIDEAADRMVAMSRLLDLAVDMIYYPESYRTGNGRDKWLADAKEIGVEPCPF